MIFGREFILPFSFSDIVGVARLSQLDDLISQLTSLFEAEGTIIGSDINLVKHLFISLKADAKEFEFIYESETYNAGIEEVFSNTMILVVPGFQEKGVRRARVKFEVMNILYQFEVQIVEYRVDRLTVKIPTELQSVQQRQTKRILVDDLFMNFIILFRSLTGGGRQVGKNQYFESRFPALMKEIKRDRPDLKLLNIIVSESLLKISEDFEMVFYHKPVEASGIEKTILHSMRVKPKTFYIPDTTKLDSYITRTDDDTLNNLNLEFVQRVMEIGEEAAKEEYEEFRKKENRDFLISYVYSPITFFDSLAGHIKIFTTAMHKYSITRDQALYIHELAEIFSYALTKVTIQRSSLNSTQAHTKILDISLEGLLFEVEDAIVFNYLKRHNIIKMFIPLNSDITLKIRGEIVRFLPRDTEFLCGVKFFDTEPDDMKHLEQYLFEKGNNVLSE